MPDFSEGLLYLLKKTHVGRWLEFRSSRSCLQYKSCSTCAQKTAPPILHSAQICWYHAIDHKLALWNVGRHFGRRKHAQAKVWSRELAQSLQYNDSTHLVSAAWARGANLWNAARIWSCYDSGELKVLYFISELVCKFYISPKALRSSLA